MAAKPKHVVSEVELAAIAGVHESTWKAHKAQGCPVPRDRRDLIPWVKRYHVWRRSQGKLAEESPAQRAAVATEQKRQEMMGLTIERQRLELDRQRGKLVSREEVVQFEHDAFFAVRQLLIAAPKKLASRLGPLCGQNGEALVEEEVRREVVGCLTTLSQGLYSKPDVAGDGRGHPPGAAAAAGADGKRVG